MGEVGGPVRVAIVSLGGTIAMLSPSGGGPVVPALSGADLVSAVPGLAECRIGLEVLDFRQLPGASLNIDDVLELTGAAASLVASGVAGVVVTQGTDTIEESAYLLDLIWRRDAPIVVTGAMRSAGAAGADGPANLLGAVQVAASGEARGLGCLVVMSDEIHAGRWVRKTHTSSVGAFASPATGPVGYVVEGRARIVSRPAGRRSVPGARSGTGVRVALLTAGLGDDGELLRSVDDRFAGAVVAGFGVGHLPVAWGEPLTDLSARMPVVLASRIGTGPVLARTYGFPGSESDLLSRGLISAGLLDAYKARILLHLLLTAGADRAAIADAFASTGDRSGADDGDL
jgi:L-asparaginase